MPACCQWCNRFVKPPDNYDRLQHVLYCSVACWWMNYLFCQWTRDETYNKLLHYKKLTKGEDDAT